MNFMATEIFPSSFRCNCEQEIDFSEGTMREMKKISKNKRVRLGEGEHTIIFDRSKAVEILCPKLGNCKITDYE